MKRKEHGDILLVKNVKVAKVVNEKSQNVQLVSPTGDQRKDQEAVNLMHENKKLRADCLEYEKRNEELNLKATQLRSAIKELDDEYSRMMAELEALEAVKEEKGI